MVYLIIKAAISGVVVMAASEIARRSPTLSHTHRGPVFCGAGLPPSVGDASLVGSNEPCLNATRHADAVLFSLSSRVPRSRRSLFVPPVVCPPSLSLVGTSAAGQRVSRSDVAWVVGRV